MNTNWKDQRLKILVVEDSDTDRMMIVKTLEQSGFTTEVKVAENIDDAFAMCSTNEFDCIFLDYFFPQKNGSDFIRSYTSKSGNASIIVVTSQEDVNMAVECMKLGAVDYLTKNQITPASIAKSLHYALAAKSSRENIYRAEQALMESELKLKSIIARSPIIFFNIDQHGVFTLYKGKAASSLMIKPEEVTGKNILEVSEKTPIKLEDYRLACKETRLNFNVQVNNQYFDVNYIPVKNELKQITGMMGVAIDVTSFKQAEDHLNNTIQVTEAASKVKEQFLANMSHEIRTPIHGIISLTQFVLGTELTAEQRQYLTLINKSADSLLVIINDILDLSKIDADKVEFEEIPFNLHDTIQTSVAAFIPKTIEKNIQIRTDLSPDLPQHLNGDPVRLTQVINNLMGNAVKFTHKGSVSIGAKVKEKNENSVVIEFTVRDTGIGIPPHKIGNIFETFSQAGADINRTYGGTGLGLSISKTLVEKQHGVIRVESLLDAGTTFTFSIPYKITPENTPGAVTQDQEITFSRQFNILVAEDNDINRFIIEKMLKDWDMKVAFAKTGTEAVEQASKSTYDLILMDVEMPDMNGYRATEIIRTEFEGPMKHVPIVALTGNAMSGEREKCLQAGMNDYISKPFKASELKDKIYQMCNATEVQQETPVVVETAATPELPTAKRITDLQFLKDISENNEQFFREFIQMFLNNTPKAITDMLEACAASDWERLRQAAHKAKPSFNYVGLKDMSMLTAKIEELAKKVEQTDQLEQMIHTVKATVEIAYRELEEELHTLTNH